MNNAEPMIRFYTIDGKKIEDLELNSSEKLDEEKDVKVSNNFNKALKTVINKDIKFLSNKLSSIIKDITKYLMVNNAMLEVKINDKLENIDESINDIETLVSNLIVKKENIKIGIFSSHKKEKKNDIKKIEDSINYLSKTLNDIISVKDEYIKLEQRSKRLDYIVIEDEEKENQIIEDPLERTINFYMAKEN